MWVKAPHTISKNDKKMSKSSANKMVDSLKYAGYSDWRLPSASEGESIMSGGALSLFELNRGRFIAASWYWTSSRDHAIGATLYMSLAAKKIGAIIPLGSFLYVWPCREFRPSSSKSL